MYASVFLKLIIIENGVHQIVNNQREGIVVVECDAIEKVETYLFLHATLSCLTFQCVDIF